MRWLGSMKFTGSSEANVMMAIIMSKRRGLDKKLRKNFKPSAKIITLQKIMWSKLVEWMIHMKPRIFGSRLRNTKNGRKKMFFYAKKNYTPGIPCSMRFRNRSQVGYGHRGCLVNELWSWLWNHFVAFLHVDKNLSHLWTLSLKQQQGGMAHAIVRWQGVFIFSRKVSSLFFLMRAKVSRKIFEYCYYFVIFTCKQNGSGFLNISSEVTRKQTTPCAGALERHY